MLPHFGHGISPPRCSPFFVKYIPLPPSYSPCRPQLEQFKYFGGFFFAILARSTVRLLLFDVIPSKRLRNRVGNLR